MKYALTFLLLSLACSVAGWLAWAQLGWLVLLYWYVALSFGLLAWAYAHASVRLFGKRSTGRSSWVSWLWLGPYRLLSCVCWWLHCCVSREPAWVQVLPNLYFGRRLSHAEAKRAQPNGWVGVLDLAVEFSEVAWLRHAPHYLSLPVLDTAAPTAQQLRVAVVWLREHVPLGPVYVHCAFGHGRSACVVIAYLLAMGEVATIQAGEHRLRSLRAGVRLTAPQTQQLQVFTQVALPLGLTWRKP